MTKSFMVLGTDQGVGKTLFCRALLHLATKRGMTTSVLKPVDTGCPIVANPTKPVQIGGMPGQLDADSAAAALFNLEQLAGPIPPYILGQTPQESLGARDGAVLLQAAARKDLDVDTISPYRFAPDLEPAICARYADREISLDHLCGLSQELQSAADLFLVEGCWSVMSPLSGLKTQLDLVKRLDLPVVLVVPSRQGAVGPCLLAFRAISSVGVKVHSVVIDRIQREIGMDEAALPFQIETYMGNIVRGVMPFLDDEQLSDLEYLSERLRVHVDVEGFLNATE